MKSERESAHAEPVEAEEFRGGLLAVSGRLPARDLARRVPGARLFRAEWMLRYRHCVISFLAPLLFAPAALMAASVPFERTETRASCRDYEALRNAYFGDLHVHTALSLDASTQGTRGLPADAYRFARGERLGIQPYDAEGRPMRYLQLERPLDFVAVTDHAEYFGELTICQTPGLEGYSSPICIIYRRWPRLAFFLMNSRLTASAAPTRYSFCGVSGKNCLSAARTPWQQVQRAAEEAYDRSEACDFTTFVGYEWTGGPGSNNIHRNVIFRNAEVPDLPISYADTPEPAALWRALLRDCMEGREGCDVLTIPHNSNISGSLMFQTIDAGGNPITAAAARTRARFEPLVEIMQHKGDSECRPGTETEDELCAFEKLPYQNFAGNFIAWDVREPGSMNFTRNVLKEGLVQAMRTGANPFKFGTIASTDTHLAAAGMVREDQHPGHGGAGAPAGREMPTGLPDDIEFNPGGLAVLWAEENSRDALFAAMRRREAYGTSGPRMVVRFFGGWSYPADLCERSNFVETGYSEGVPMGGDLPALLANAASVAPRFAVWALRDAEAAGPEHAALQRVQVIKGWVENGTVREKVYDVVGNRDNGAAVDTRSCATTGAGFDDLCTVWLDPDFDRDVPAFYYARVVQNPTCRWHTYLCNARNVDCAKPETVGAGFEPCCDPLYPKTIQERAWTSPIWYTPAAPDATTEQALSRR